MPGRVALGITTQVGVGTTATASAQPTTPTDEAGLAHCSGPARVRPVSSVAIAATRGSPVAILTLDLAATLSRQAQRGQVVLGSGLAYGEGVASPGPTTISIRALRSASLATRRRRIFTAVIARTCFSTVAHV